MRICLLSIVYPPESTEGIARQRQVLAEELSRRGHDVHVITCGGIHEQRSERGVTIHVVNVPTIHHFSDTHVHLDTLLTYSQALYLGLQRATNNGYRFDIVDVPLWAAQGFVTVQRYTGQLIVWLQTTSAQLREINGQPMDASARALMALERLCLERADGLLSDSHAALDSVMHSYNPQTTAPSHIAYLGIPDSAEPLLERPQRMVVEALVVGRLERRKGTPLLLEILPGVLRHNPWLRVRFVGADNSHNDGWFEQHGHTYVASFQHQNPDLAEKVIFDGFVSETVLDQRYREADMVLVPSVYESFGIVYIEAMRNSLPTITFAVGGACEIFVSGELHGAILVPPGEWIVFRAAIERLAQSHELRIKLGASGVQRFQEAFTAVAMADTTLTFYEQVCRDNKLQRNSSAIYQVMEDLDTGDAVSSIVRRSATILADIKQPREIIALAAHKQLDDRILPPHHLLHSPNSSLIFHYWGYNRLTWLLWALNGPMAIYYHNITPPSFFPSSSPMHQALTRGYAQLAHIAKRFDVIIADSSYNLSEFALYTNQQRPALHIYPVVEPSDIQHQPFDSKLLQALRSSNDVNIVFVGRVVRNKRQDKLMVLFDYYCQHINPCARLWLVGNDKGDIDYRSELEILRTSLRSGEQITFTGKVTDDQVLAYYRGADALVCASEHEGFCVPIAQAMALDVPVLAYAAAAVPETMGSAGLLIHEWDTIRVAELLHLAIFDHSLRSQLIEGQRANIMRFSSTAAKERLEAVIQFLIRGEQSHLFQPLQITNTVA